MASNQTENFGLNQWSEKDKVLCEDFNRDNRKIDAAILENQLLMSAVRLGTFSIPIGSTQLDLNLSQFNLEEYAQVEICLHRIATNQAGTIYFTLNNIRDQYCDSINTNYLNTLQSFATHNDGTGLYCVGGRITIRLDSNGLAGIWETSMLRQYSGKFYSNISSGDWGIHPNFLPISSLETFNLSTNTTFAGGTVTVIGHRR